MVRRDNPAENVRPLTPGDGAAEEHAVRVRPSIGIAIGAGAVVLLLVLVVFGAGGGNNQTGSDPESETAADVAANVQTPPTTLPAALSQLIPVETDQLVAVSRSGDPRTVVWLPSERFAQSYRLPSVPMSAAFDSVSRTIAFIDFSSTLFAGPLPGDTSVPIEAMVSAAVFHPTEPADLAYTAAPNGAGSNALRRLQIASDLPGGVGSTLIAPLDDGTRLLTWGDWGYAVATEEPAAVVILDPAGRPRRTMGGIAYAAGGDAILVDTTGSADAGALGRLAPTVVDRAPMIGVVDLDFEPTIEFTELEAGNSSVTISTDGLRIAVLTHPEAGGTLLTIHDRSRSAIVTADVELDAIAYALGFTADGALLTMQDTNTDEILMVDWLTGVHYRIPGLTGDFIAAGLAPPL